MLLVFFVFPVTQMHPFLSGLRYFNALPIRFVNTCVIWSLSPMQSGKSLQMICALRSSVLYFTVSMQKPDETLLSGALVAISALLKEISSKKSPLKVVRQEGFSILIEEGEKVLVAFISTQELKIIRKKILDFLGDFEILFEDLLNLKIADINAFLPTKTIVRKYFA